MFGVLSSGLLILQLAVLATVSLLLIAHSAAGRATWRPLGRHRIHHCLAVRALGSEPGLHTAFAEIASGRASITSTRWLTWGELIRLMWQIDVEPPHATIVRNWINFRFVPSE